jgi:release factor glutamine methyltransferase
VTPSIRALLTEATARLAAAGVSSPSADARLLLAHVSGLGPAELLLRDGLDNETAARFRALLDRRAEQVPLQHLTGRAYFRHLELMVGLGVFVPRPETEVMTGWAIEQLRRLRSRRDGGLIRVVELCAGSGAISAALASEVDWGRGELDLHAVEVSEVAAGWAARNLAGLPVTLHVRDMAGCLTELSGSVDLVIANQPYIPLEAYEAVPVDVRDHEPGLALWSGEDGLDAVRVVVREAARLLTPGGLLAYEHAEVQGETAPAVAVDSGRFDAVRDHPDLTGRARFVTAVRRGAESAAHVRPAVTA